MNIILVKYCEKNSLLNCRLCAFLKEETACFQWRVKNFLRPG